MASKKRQRTVSAAASRSVPSLDEQRRLVKKLMGKPPKEHDEESLRALFGGQSPLRFVRAQVSMLRAWWDVFQYQLNVPARSTGKISASGSSEELLDEEVVNLNGRWSGYRDQNLTIVYGSYSANMLTPYVIEYAIRPDDLSDEGLDRRSVFEELLRRTRLAYNQKANLVAVLEKKILTAQRSLQEVQAMAREFPHSNLPFYPKENEEQLRFLVQTRIFDLLRLDDLGMNTIFALIAAVEDFYERKDKAGLRAEAPSGPFHVLRAANLTMQPPIPYREDAATGLMYACPVKKIYHSVATHRVVGSSWDVYGAWTERVENLLLAMEMGYGHRPRSLGKPPKIERKKFLEDIAREDFWARLDIFSPDESDLQHEDSTRWLDLPVPGRMMLGFHGLDQLTYNKRRNWPAWEDRFNDLLMSGFGASNLLTVAMTTMVVRAAAEHGPFFETREAPRSAGTVQALRDIYLKTRSGPGWKVFLASLKNLSMKDSRLGEYKAKIEGRLKEALDRAFDQLVALTKEAKEKDLKELEAALDEIDADFGDEEQMAMQTLELTDES